MAGTSALREPRADEHTLDNRRPRERLAASRLVTTSLEPHTALRTVVGLAILIESTLANGDVRIRVIGELDFWSAPILAEALADLRPPTRGPSEVDCEAVLDLHELSFLDCGGITALEAGRTALLAAGWLVASGRAQPQVGRLLHFAERSGWLVDRALAEQHSAAGHRHAAPATAAERRRPRAATGASPTGRTSDPGLDR